MSKLQNTIEQARFTANKGITMVSNTTDKFLSYSDCYSRTSVIAKQMVDNRSNYLIIIQDRNADYLPMLWAGILLGKIVVPMNVDTVESIRKLHNIWLFLDKPAIALSLSMKKIICEKYSFEGDPFYTPTSECNASDNDFTVKKDEDDVALIMFSSGTTGEPKGVELTSGNIFCAVNSLINHYELTSDDVFLNWMSLTHAIGLNIFHIVPLFLKANHVLLDQISYVSDPSIWMSKASFYRATVTCSANFGFSMASQNVSQGKFDLSCVRVIIAAGEPVSSYVINEFLAKHAKHGLSRNSVKNLYGMTESVLGITATSCHKPSADVLVNKKHLSVGDEVKYICDNRNLGDGSVYSSSGVALECVRVRVVDDRNNVLKNDTVGHIQISGRNITHGYHKIDNSSYFTLDGWLRTGDIGFLTKMDNNLVIVGREKDIIIVNGRNYYCSDLERMIQQVEGINIGDVAIASIFSSEMKRETPIIFVKESVFSDIHRQKEISNKIKRTMSINAGIRVEKIVLVDAIPTTAAGKIKRMVLVNKYSNGGV